jgi:hypothetical protein
MNQFHRPIGMLDDESDVAYDTRMLAQMGFIPARRRILKRTPEEQLAWEKENQMDAKRKAIEVDLRTSQSTFSKKRKFQTITNLSTAIQDVDTAVDGRLLQLAFPEAPVDFVGYAGHRMSAARKEPGHTLIREYVDANSRPGIANTHRRVHTEVQEVVRDLFDENPGQAESRLVQFLNDTCTGDSHDAKPFIRHLEPFDIKASTLVCMLDSIYQQGKGQTAQLTELRNQLRAQNLEHTQQNKQQIQEQMEHNTRQEKKLKQQGVQLQQQNYALEQQNDKLDQLLLHVQNSNLVISHLPTPALNGNNVLADPDSISMLVTQAQSTRAMMLETRQEQREAKRLTLKKAVIKLFIIGEHNGACINDQLTQDEISLQVAEHEVVVTIVGLGKALIGLGATTARPRNQTGEKQKIFKFIKIRT